MISTLFQIALLLKGDKSPNKNKSSSSGGGGGLFIPEVIRLELNKIGLEEETNEDTNENTKISFYEGKNAMLMTFEIISTVAKLDLCLQSLEYGECLYPNS